MARAHEHESTQKNPEDFPVGSAFRRLLEEHDGVIPTPSDESVGQMVDYAERIERLTPSLNPDAYKLLKTIERRLGLPELPAYVMSGDKVRYKSGVFYRSSGAIFVAQDLLQSPLEPLESVLLHEIGHGFEDERFVLAAGKAVQFLESTTVHSLWSDLLFEASSCLYTAARLVYNAARMVNEVRADKFAVQHESDPSHTSDDLADTFRHRYSSTAPPGRSPFTPEALIREAVDFLDNIVRREHPLYSIRYVLSAREAAQEIQRRQL